MRITRENGREVDVEPTRQNIGVKVHEKYAVKRLGYQRRTWESDSVFLTVSELRKILKYAEEQEAKV